MYQVLLERKAVKFLEKIKEPDYSKIKLSILNLSSNPRPVGFKKLKGREAYPSGKEITELFTKSGIKFLKFLLSQLVIEKMFIIPD